MTPERLTGLAALLLEYRDWLAEDVPGTLEQAQVEAVVDFIGVQRRRLVEELAK